MTLAAPSQSLLDALATRPLLGDGAMGTQLMEAGLAPGASGELWNLEQPDAIEAIHQRYRDAGSDLLTTNTFNGTRTALAKHGLEDRTVELNRAGAEAARKAAGEAAWVLADAGPCGDFLEPLGTMDPEQLLEIFSEQYSALRSGGADAALAETMTDPAEMAVAIRAAKAVADWPVVATFAFDKAGEDYRTMMGADAAAAIGAAVNSGADVVGANCGTSLDLEDYLRLAERLIEAAEGRPVILQPNAGSPQLQGDRQVFPAKPEDMARLTSSLLDAGVKVVGGCCGTTPEHLAAMRQVIPR